MEHMRLQWLQKLDVAERSVWVEEFRGGGATLGKVIKDTVAKRDAHWEATPAARAQAPRDEAQQQAGATAPRMRPRGKAQAKNPRGPGKGGGGGKPGSGGGHRILTRFKDGKVLCAEFQKGRWSKKPCSSGLRRCGVAIKSGRVCGALRTPAEHR